MAISQTTVYMDTLRPNDELALTVERGEGRIFVLDGWRNVVGEGGTRAEAVRSAFAQLKAEGVRLSDETDRH